MTPQPISGRAMGHRRRLARPAGLAAAVALIVGGAPLMAHALDEPAAPPAAPSESALSLRTLRATEAASSLPSRSGLGSDLGRALAPAVASADRSNESEATRPADADEQVEEKLAAVVAILSDTYDVGERGPRVAALQHLLGVTADGWYGRVTGRAHVAAAAEAGLLDGLPPQPVVPAGPAASEWAALRECESGGDYSITNPSGKYRGAYQFDRSTWNSVAGRHAPALVGVDPAAASPADQDAMALALYTERGARPWPHCGRHLS